MNKKLEIQIVAHAKDILPTKNGILLEQNLKFARETVLFDALRRHTSLVEIKQGYPENDNVKVDLDLDIVVLSRARFNELKENETNYKSLQN